MLDVNSILWLLNFFIGYFSASWLVDCWIKVVFDELDGGTNWHDVIGLCASVVVFYELDGDINWHDVIGLLNFFNSSVGKLVGTLSRGGLVLEIN
ncbi:hypothetical protein Acr_02g0004470 [Actinidia rufa]|uniref:Uncharacterized protein n=1 Tax=Actinidia rufa TaxID=165716 RepID=A0A7J0E961_9ERIC|nr:hypothetical protein Acr_02g0004470 [Actinidia rufa]